MLRTLCKSKIHRATVTETNLNYKGSITIDQKLLVAAGLLPFEQVQVLNINNGQRATTYCIPGNRGNGEICLNGPTARLAQVGDLVIIIAYGLFDESECMHFKPAIVHVNKKNRIISTSKRIKGRI